MFTKRHCFLTIFLICCILLHAQEFTPIVKQFVKKDYNAANQNWAVGQTSDGVMYFGNNQCLLEFDGSMWRSIKLPQNKIVRSLMIDKNDRIYVGSFQEFGFFEKNAFGNLQYTSLSAELKDYKMKNDEIWNIIELNGTVIFQSFTSYFIYDGKSTKGLRCKYTFLFFNIYKNRIYTHTNQNGFSQLTPLIPEVSPVLSAELKSPVISVLNHDANHALLVTKADGLFLFDGINISRFITDADDELRRSDVNRATVSKDGVILIGTILNGVIAIDKTGHKLWMLNSSNVLQNNTILGMHCDKDNNLWVCLDKGISMIQLNSSLKYIHSFSPAVGAIYSLSYEAPYLYIGTNQGLYSARFDVNRKTLSEVRFESAVKGQVWNLTNIDGQHLCGNNEQTFEIKNRNASMISPVRGGMCISKGVIHGQEVLVQGTYSELCIYLKKDGRWEYSHSVEQFINPIRYIEIDYTGTIWASHMHQGLYAIQLTNDLRKIASLRTFNSLDQKNEYNINVFSVNNRVVFTDHNSFYTFDDINKKIIPHKELNKHLGNFGQAYRVCHFKSDLYWFIRNGEAALVQIQPNSIKLIDIVQYSLFLNQTVDDYQNIIPVSDSECIFTLENGLAIYDAGKFKPKANDTKLQLKSIQTSDAESKETIYLNLSDSVRPVTSYKFNNIIFTVFYPNYSQLDNVNYRFKLEGLDKVWSEPGTASWKRYNYLPYGDYNLKVEVLSNSGFRLGSLNYRFEVNPPFYLSTVAKIIYLLLVISLLFGVYMYIKHLFVVKKEKIHEEQESIRKKEIEKRERQIIALEKEKLESELTLKSKELAESTMTIIKKNEILVNIKEEVMAQKNILGSQYPNKYYDKLIKLLDENLSSEADWAIFQTNFDRIHENFFRNLLIKYPELTSNDLRFCAYLRLNLSSKDIAHLMNISLKGVEVGRYRIRKKIGIPSSKSLTEFMIEFK